MKISRRSKAIKRIVIFAGLFYLFINFSVVIPSQNAFCFELKSQAEEMLKEKRFIELLNLLETLKKDPKGPEALQLEYYSVLAKSMYLDYLEQNEDWENYYNNVDMFNADIIESVTNAARENPVSNEIIQMQYFTWQAYMRDDDQTSAEEAFDALVEMVIAYTEKTNDISVFKNIAQRISDQGRVGQLNELFNSYKEYLSRNNVGAASIENLSSMAAEYLKEGKTDTARVVYKNYIDLVLENYSKEKALLALLDICAKFRHHGFSKGMDSNFAEEVYESITKNVADDALAEEDLFARAYNLEMILNYNRAQEEYNRFIKKFPESKFLPEVYTRLGAINLYNLGQIDRAQLFFKKVVDDFPKSFFTPFCTYQSALLWQWQAEEKKASNLYDKLIEKGGNFSDKAKMRLAEIKNKSKIDKSARFAFDLMLGEEESSTIMMTLESNPERSFVDQQVIWTATAQDFSSGTIQPFFTYRWYGDTGSNDDPGNVTEFSTTYAQALPQLVWFYAATGEFENIICSSLWVHEIVINSPGSDDTFKVGTPVEFSAEISPISVEDEQMSWKWNILGQDVSKQGKKIKHTFSQAGSYEGQAEVTIQGIKAVKNFSIKVIE